MDAERRCYNFSQAEQNWTIAPGSLFIRCFFIVITIITFSAIVPILFTLKVLLLFRSIIWIYLCKIRARAQSFL